jgi:predicted transport protein
VLRKKGLRLGFNVPLAQFHDPKGRCKDRAGQDNHGDCDVEVWLRSIDELLYVMGLVRQSYEYQMSKESQT